MFDIAVMIIQLTVALLPFLSVAATIYMAWLWWNSGQPRNKVLRTATLTSTLATAGGMWWAIVATRRILLGSQYTPLPEVFILAHGLSLIAIMITPVIKVFELVRISREPLTQEQVDDLRRLEYNLIQHNPTQNQAEDKKFGDERRELERQHNVDRP